LDSGHGLVSTESRILTESKFSFKQRVEGEGRDTNPEELIAASAASCFAMALSKTLQDEDKVAVKPEPVAALTEGTITEAHADAADIPLECMQATTMKLDTTLHSAIRRMKPRDQTLRAFVRELVSSEEKRRTLEAAAETYGALLASRKDEAAWLAAWKSPHSPPRLPTSTALSSAASSTGSKPTA